MPLFKYILVALLGSGGAPSAAPSVTLGDDAIVQPNGGVLLVGQEPPKKDDSRRVKRKANFTRHKRSRRPIKRTFDPKKDGGSKRQ